MPFSETGTRKIKERLFFPIRKIFLKQVLGEKNRLFIPLAFLSNTHTHSPSAFSIVFYLQLVKKPQDFAVWAIRATNRV